jgi:hypothetical protein
MITTSRREAAFSLAILLFFIRSAVSETNTLPWPEAVAPLAGGKTMAEACVSLLKRYGTEAQVAMGRLEYSKAKSDSDAVVAGLITALAAGQNTTALPSLQSKLTSSLSGLDKFCNSVKEILPPTPTGERGLQDALSIIKEAIGPLLTGGLAGVAALYNNYRTDIILTRRSIQQQLESARWPDFENVKRPE